MKNVSGFCLRQVLPLEPVDHVSHQGIGDAGVGLLSQQDGLPQLIQDHGVPIHLLLSCLQLGGGRKVRRQRFVSINNLDQDLQSGL